MPYVTINTHQGLYQYTRLPFGIASAPAIFQRLMETILQGIPGVVCYIDDILVTGKNEEEHLEPGVFEIEESWVSTQERKMQIYGTKSVEYLGHKIDKDRISALYTKQSRCHCQCSSPNQRARATLIPGLIELQNAWQPFKWPKTS